MAYRGASRAWLAFGAMVMVAGGVVGGVGCGQTMNLENNDQGVGLPNGTACTGTSDCMSGFCVDGVCCESACNGTCEACNLPNQAGTCAPIAAGTDPQMECMPQPLPTPPDGGTDDGGVQVNLPDGGVVAMAGPCAPTCNGQRACGFPDETVSCGSTFCNTSDQEGEAVCDGTGHCGLNVVSCDGYVCSNDVCETTCTTDADCDSTHYCDGQHCQPKKTLGIPCDSDPNECQSNYCVDNVCCNSACTFNGGECNVGGSVGQCHCVTNYAPQGSTQCNGSCEYYYPDVDGDLFGSSTGTPIVGCTGDPNDPPPAHYIAASATQNGIPSGNTDCGDDDPNVNPGITSFDTSATWVSVHTPKYDWNCDGTVTYEWPDTPGGTCQFCSPSSQILDGTPCGGTSSTCSYAGQYPSIDCSVSQRNPCTPSPGHFCLISFCCGVGCADPGFLDLNQWGVVSGVYGCGQTVSVKWCSETACAATGDAVPTEPAPFNETMGCL